ncbi:MAG: holB [Francisellaceae bacterium]|nr:holB [Francisellaceae bacterium]
MNYFDKAHSQLIQWYKSNRFPHALLVNGPKKIGKFSLINQFSHLLLCENFSRDISLPCNKCKSCLLFLSKTHPDLKVIQPEISQPIKIDEIRELSQWVVKKPMIHKIKMIIINHADSLNIQASNALLKILEEPPHFTYFMLITNQSFQLLPTIKSRCQELKFRLNFNEWKQLQIENQADFYHRVIENLLLFLNHKINTLELAALWMKEDINLLLQGLMWFYTDLIIYKLSPQHPALIDSWKNFYQQGLNLYNDSTLFGPWDQLIAIKKILKEPTYPNIQLLLEKLCILINAPQFSKDAIL